MSRPAHRLLPLALVFACFGALQAHAADLTVTLQGVRAQTGVLKLAVVDSQAGWDGQAQPVKADAVLVTHDENGNGKLDSNMIGMPVEAYGFSNNPNVMRKPTWDEARFEVGVQDAAIAITLR